MQLIAIWTDLSVRAESKFGKQTSETQIGRILGPDEHTAALGRFALFDCLRWTFSP
jgi:hypothetical protein